MAKFGIEQTGLSGADTSAAGFIRPAVVDRSREASMMNTTNTIANLAEIGKGAYEGYQLAGVETETEKLVQDFMDRRNPEDLALQAESLKQTDVTLFQQPGITPKELEPVQQQFNTTIERYRKAKEQGVMSPTEFYDRSLKILREAVNKNPGMQKKLTDHLDNVLKLSGIQSLIEQDKSDREKIASSQKAIQSHILDIAKQANTPLMFNEDGSLDLAEINKQNNVWIKQQQILKAGDTKITFSVNDFRTFGVDYANGKLSAATQLAIANITDPSISPDKAITNVNNILDKTLDDFITNPRVAPIIDQAPVKATIDHLRTQIESMKANLTKYESGEQRATYLKNAENSLRSEQYMAASKLVNPVMLDLTSKLMNSPGMQGVIMKRPDLQVQYHAAAAKALEGLGVIDPNFYVAPTKGETPLSVQMINQFAIDAVKPTGEKDIQGLSNTIKSITQGTSSLDESTKYRFYYDYIKALGSPVNKMGIAKLDSDAITSASQSLNDYMSITTKGLANDLISYKNKGVDVQLDVLPDGRITINSKDPSVTDLLTKKYTIRMNHSLAAYSNITNSVQNKEVAKKFFSTFINVGQTKQKENVITPNKEPKRSKDAEGTPIIWSEENSQWEYE